jgi:RimJ/RimL family protein N-acetyltransferase
MYAALRSPSFPRDVPLGQIKSLEGVEARITRSHSAWAAGRVYIWSIESREDHTLLGQVTLSRRPEADTWALAYWIDPECWGQGYASEAARRIMEFGFERLGAVLIWAGAAVWNQASIRVLEKLGMRHVADNPGGYVINDEPIPTREYEITRERWQELCK